MKERRPRVFLDRRPSPALQLLRDVADLLAVLGGLLLLFTAPLTWT